MFPISIFSLKQSECRVFVAGKTPCSETLSEDTLNLLKAIFFHLRAEMTACLLQSKSDAVLLSAENNDKNKN